MIPGSLRSGTARPTHEMGGYLLIVLVTAPVIAAARLFWPMFRCRAHNGPQYVGKHRREPGQGPSGALYYAIVTAGTHGLGMSQRRVGDSDEGRASSIGSRFNGGHEPHKQLVKDPSKTIAVDQRSDVARCATEQRLHYRGLLMEFPVIAEADPERISLQVGNDVDALFMSAGFAAEVNSFLARHMLHAPIIVTPEEPSDWIFLTQPRTALRLPVWKDLAHMGIRWRRRGESITLPAFGAGTGMRWLEPLRRPVDLPSWTSVVGAARSVWKSSGE